MSQTKPNAQGASACPTPAAVAGLAVAILAVAMGCERETAPQAESAEASESLLTMEEVFAELMPPLPTHWLASEPVGDGSGPVSDAMLRDPYADPRSWLHYQGDYRGLRHSPLTSLDPDSVRKLQVAWSFPTGTQGQFETSPIVHAGVMYITSSYNRLFALDARSGELLWRYDHQMPEDLRACCGPINRGASIVGDTVLMATLDAKLVALDRRTGAILWETLIADYADGFSATSTPLIVGQKAIIGVAGGEYGARGHFDAYDVRTGERLWRHHTIPAAGEPGVETWAGNSYETGGAPAWTQGVYDAETDTLFWTTGNPSPDFNGDLRAGDNLYSNSVLAVDAESGERKWHFQFTPHDVWDLDGNTQLFLLDVVYEGERTPVVAQANRNGYFYLIDRRDGRFLRATTYVEQMNWATIDATGRPVINPLAWPQEEPSFRMCPSNMGGMNGAWTGSYDHALGLVFIPAIESCMKFATGIVTFVRGAPFIGGTPDAVDAAEGKAYGHLSAIDVATGEVRWRYRDELPMMAGALSTAGGVVFTGNLGGKILAIDSRSGDLVWSFRMGGGVRSQPVAFELDGRPYVAMGSGSWATTDSYVAGVDKLPEGGQLFVFSIPGD